MYKVTTPDTLKQEPNPTNMKAAYNFLDQVFRAGHAFFWRKHLPLLAQASRLCLLSFSGLFLAQASSLSLVRVVSPHLGSCLHEPIFLLPTPLKTPPSNLL